jgi:hypothetical protein
VTDPRDERHDGLGIAVISLAAFLHRRHVIRPGDVLVVVAYHVEASGLGGACSAALREIQARTTRDVSRA